MGGSGALRRAWLLAWCSVVLCVVVAGVQPAAASDVDEAGPRGAAAPAEDPACRS